MKKLLYAVLTGCMAWSFVSIAINSSKTAAVEDPGPMGITKNA